MNFNTLRTNVRDRLEMLPIKPDDYLKHIIDTYFSTRFGIGVIGIAFPIILWLIGLKFGVPLQGSISAYYHTPMRNVFVGILFAIGASLFLYKGYGTTEDFVLDAAGILALCIDLYCQRHQPLSLVVTLLRHLCGMAYLLSYSLF